MSHTEKTLQNMIMELAYLLEKREERVAGALAIILDQKMCLHCSRIYLNCGMAEPEGCTAVRHGFPSTALVQVRRLMGRARQNMLCTLGKPRIRKFGLESPGLASSGFQRWTAHARRKHSHCDIVVQACSTILLGEQQRLAFQQWRRGPRRRQSSLRGPLRRPSSPGT